MNPNIFKFHCVPIINNNKHNAKHLQELYELQQNYKKAL